MTQSAHMVFMGTKQAQNHIKVRTLRSILSHLVLPMNHSKDHLVSLNPHANSPRRVSKNETEANKRKV